MSLTLEELKQDPFDTHEFVERLAWRTMGTKARSQHDEFDPMLLLGAFEKMISELKVMNKKVQAGIDKLEVDCKDEERKLWSRIGDLQRNNQAANSNFEGLAERINVVATKVVHLGDQLEGVNTPRARAVEAQKLMNYLSEFLTDEPPKSAIFTDPFQLQLAAEIIQKLHMIALELPSNEKFSKARKKIADKYDQIENELIEEFRIAHHSGDKRKMKRCASVLSNFKGLGRCIDTFIEETQKGKFLSADPFSEVLPLCTRSNELIQEVFTNPEAVMGKLVQNIYITKLQVCIQNKLNKKDDPEQYLKDFHDIYTRTTKLSSELAQFKIGTDSSSAAKLTKTIFQNHLDNYISFEIKYLNERCGAILQRYYEGKDHHKKQIQSGGLSELRSHLQAKMATVNMNINIGPTVENYGGETFLSQEVSINILQETKLAFKRCQQLSVSSDVSGNAVKILDILIKYLVVEHIDYAVEVGLQGIPVGEPKTPPQIYFFDTVQQANTLFHLFEKQFMDSAVPLLIKAVAKNGQGKEKASTPLYADCLHKKRDLREHLEAKIDTGLDRAVTSICGWVRNILSTEQKKNDFKPDDDSVLAQMGTQASAKVVKFVTQQHQTVRNNMDGKNVEAVLLELGTRLHRIIYDHLCQFTYNSLGAMLVICDVNEYRKCVKEFGLPLISQLFEKLHALCNLLVVVPENLKQVCGGEQLAGLDKSVLLSFVQLRSDYKTAKLATLMK
ncbi:exocyst complex component 5-like isoform X2 [Dreissena polymorpha]|uniref:exocyst complex component 5-like isoform X2 n=1 Tax=Dreissena polymorpha TaxID=45954 RepID=UPI002264B20F|nr:exocyst complex component 5-like isoform X2 [Dreissena polymorpha]